MGLLVAPLAALLVAGRSWMLLKILVFTVPAGLTAFLVYSDRGATYHAVHHHFAMAIILALLLARGGPLRAPVRGDLRGRQLHHPPELLPRYL